MRFLKTFAHSPLGILLAMPLFFLGLQPPAQAEMTGAEIMQKVRDQIRSQDRTTDMTMRIQARRGERVRQIRMYSKSYGDVDKTLLRFLKPTDVKGTGFLIWGHKERNDDQWLYLPALKRVKKIASNKRGGSFMGSDFSYYDMEDRSVDESEHRLVSTEPCGDTECYVIESIDKDKKRATYSKALVWVQKDIFVNVKMELFDKKGKHIKTATFGDYEKIKGYWVAKKVTMKNLKKKSQTVLELSNIRIDEGLGDEFFTQRYLQRAL